MTLQEVCDSNRIKIYGKLLDDKLESELAKKLTALNAKYVILHPPVPINARPCQRPGTRLGQITLQSGEVKGFRLNLRGVVRAI